MLILIGLVILIVGVVLIIKITSHFSVENIVAFLEEIESWAGPLYIGLFAILPGLFIPIIALIIPGGAIFGVARASLYLLIGAGLNLTWTFLSARYFFQDQMQKFIRKKIGDSEEKTYIWNKLQALSSNPKSFRLLFLIRLSPLIPFTLINYAAGLTELDFKLYLASSLLGFMPKAIAYLYLGDQVLHFSPKKFILSLLIVVLIAGGSAIITKKYLEEENPESNLDQEK